jgi:hypothetical protein
VGPLPIEGQVARTARFMEATFTDGMRRAMSHRHSRPESWYVFEGVQCLESPKGATVVRAGKSSWIEEGPSMHPSHFSQGVRRALIHRSKVSSQTVTPEWSSRGCAQMSRSGCGRTQLEPTHFRRPELRLPLVVTVAVEMKR